MPSFVILGEKYAAAITYQVKQDRVFNQSEVTITQVELKALEARSLEVSVTGGITIDGATAVRFNNCPMIITEEYAPVEGMTGKTVTVEHKKDGTGKIIFGAMVLLQTAAGWMIQAVNRTREQRLPTIRILTELRSQMSLEDCTLGRQHVIRLERASEKFRDTITWSCGSRSGTIAEKTEETEIAWFPPLELAEENTAGTDMTMTVVAATWHEDELLGTRTVKIGCHIPEEVVPRVSVRVSDKTGSFENFYAYIQSVSQIVVQTTAEGIYGSTIENIRVECGKLTGAGEQVVFALEESGSIPIIVTATDSRGRTGFWEGAVQVQPYQKPVVTIRQVYRCDEQGQQQPDGGFLKVVFDAEVNREFNRVIYYYGRCAVHGGGQQREEEILDCFGESSVSGGSFIMSAGIDTAYDCQVIVQDEYNRVESAPVPLSVAFALLDLSRNTRAVGIGMRARNPGKLSIGMDTDMEEHTIGNLADPTQEQDGATKAYVDRVFSGVWQRVYPVGCVYASASAADPGELFGGSWEQLEEGAVSTWKRTE